MSSFCIVISSIAFEKAERKAHIVLGIALVLMLLCYLFNVVLCWLSTLSFFIAWGMALGELWFVWLAGSIILAKTLNSQTRKYWVDPQKKEERDRAYEGLTLKEKVQLWMAS